MRNVIQKLIIPSQSNQFFSTLRSNIEISTQHPLISFRPNDSIRDVLGSNSTILYEDYDLSPNPIDILFFDNVFLECDIAQTMIFRARKTNIIHNCAMDADPGYEYIEKFRGGVQWFMMERKDIISSVFLN